MRFLGAGQGATTRLGDVQEELASTMQHAGTLPDLQQLGTDGSGAL